MATNNFILTSIVFLVLIHFCQGEINELIDDNDDIEKDSIDKLLSENGIGQQRYTQNTIQRYKCHSCEQPDCRESPEGTHMCQNAFQCWKSRTRNAEGVETVSRGCIVEHDKLPFFCNYARNSRSVRHAAGQYNIECCHGDYCNNGTFPELPPLVSDDHDATRLDHAQNKLLLSIAVLGPVLIIVLAIAIIVPMRRTHHKRLLSLRTKQDPESYYAGDELLRVTSAGDSTLREYMQHSMTSGSGSGLPLLVQRTLTKQVTLIHEIGKGRYGKVYLGNWHGDQVAVKIFYSRDEESWKRETEIYSTILLRHENILGYIGSDMTSHNNSSTQLWVLTDYYPLGSLFDHLQRKALTHNDMITICLSIASGLVHLHTEIFSTESKPAIAHRDLKSKNILVRENGTCVIADFGLAAIHTQATSKLDLGTNPRVGTKRYMSPEILDQSININCFESLRRADIYAFGLIMWEICRRTISGGIAEEYKIPYYDVVPSDPSFEDMKKVVCDDNYRPSIPNRWSSDILLSGMAKRIRECWHQKANARLTALRMKKYLQNMAASADDVKTNLDSEVYVRIDHKNSNFV